MPSPDHIERPELTGDELRRLIAEGQRDADAGDLVDADEVFEELRRLSERRRAAGDGSSTVREEQDARLRRDNS